MKLKKVNEGFAICNCKISIDGNRLNYVTRYKQYRIRFKERIYFNWRRSWFIYKNLELNCWREFIIFALI